MSNHAYFKLGFHFRLIHGLLNGCVGTYLYKNTNRYIPCVFRKASHTVSTLNNCQNRIKINNGSFIISPHQGAWLTERSNKPDVAGSIPVSTEFFLISCDSNSSLSGSEPTTIWRSHYNISKMVL